MVPRHDGQVNREDRRRQAKDDPVADGMGRRSSLPQRHGCEHTQKDGKADCRFGGKDDLRHGNEPLGFAKR